MHISKHSCYRTMFDYISVATQKKPAGELDNNAWTSPNHLALNQLPAPPANLQTILQKKIHCEVTRPPLKILMRMVSKVK